jgi:hypothetical protein
MITEADEVIARVEIALGMLPHVIDVPITDSEIVEIAEQAPPGSHLHSAFVAREFILERQAWIALGDKTTAEAALRSLAQLHGCQLNFAGEAFVFFKERKSEAIAAIAAPTAVVRRISPR